jgi:hypothetical protein
MSRVRGNEKTGKRGKGEKRKGEKGNLARYFCSYIALVAR